MLPQLLVKLNKGTQFLWKSKYTCKIHIFNSYFSWGNLKRRQKSELEPIFKNWNSSIFINKHTLIENLLPLWFVNLFWMDKIKSFYILTEILRKLQNFNLIQTNINTFSKTKTDTVKIYSYFDLARFPEWKNLKVIALEWIFLENEKSWHTFHKKCAT